MQVSPPALSHDESVARTLFGLSVGVFTMGGFLTSTVGLLVPRLTITLGLDYSRALLVQFAFHLSYLIFAVPIALLIMRAGYMRAIASGLSVMVVGCALLVGSAYTRSFGLVLIALLTLSTGITFLQIAANTVVTVVGPSRHAAARLTLLQGFNSAGTVLGPLIGAVFLLGSIPGGASSPTLWETTPFIFAGIALAILAGAFAFRRDLLPRVSNTLYAAKKQRFLSMFCNRRVAFGTGAIFAYVGAEVTIGTLLPNFLMLPTTLHVRPVIAGQISSFYWGGAMVGRFAGAFMLRRSDAGLALTIVCTGALVLTVIASGGAGVTASIALLSIGLCNAIMYPTIYALALPADPAEATLGSMLMCMAVVGGAVVPLITGALADRVGLPLSLLVPATCYGLVAAFGWSVRR